MVEKKNISRRTFIKGTSAAAILAGVGGTVANFDGELDASQAQAATSSTATKCFNSCPRNCYDTCSVVSTVEDGVITYVTGNPNNTYTNGRLCVKGYSYPRSIYSPDRIKYPMKQNGKGTGDWERISWDEAYDLISDKILDIKERYGDTIPIALDKYSGNFNILSYCVEGMMTSFGHTTRVVGTPCWPAGIDSQSFDFGGIVNSDPETFVNSEYLIIWGANPAWCSVHSMAIIQKAKENGTKIIAIDSIQTDTASKADMFVEIKPSTDGSLALGMCKYILDNNLHDLTWMEENSIGYQNFLDYLDNNVTLEWASETSGVPVATIELLAKEYAAANPASIWIGYGMQRHTNGGASVRAIDALVAMSGNIGKLGGGANYAQLDTWGYTYNAQVHTSYPEGTPEGADRGVNINNFGAEVLDINTNGDIPVEMLWVACRNPISQAAETGVMKKCYESIDMVVVADMYMNPTVEMADIVLPVTTIFETWGVHSSYWHYWININEQAIDPLYEAKCDVEIAMGLSAALNAKEPGSCTFNTTMTSMRDWVEAEMLDSTLASMGLSNWEELLETGTAKVQGYETPFSDGVFRTPSTKYEFISENAAKYDNHPLPAYRAEEFAPSGYPYRVLTPHWKLGLHSQFQNLDWMSSIHNEPFVEMHSSIASSLGIEDGEIVKVSSDIGFVTVKTYITDTTPIDSVVIYEAWYKDIDFNVNYIVKATPADMGAFATGKPGIAFHDSFVKIEKL